MAFVSNVGRNRFRLLGNDKFKTRRKTATTTARYLERKNRNKQSTTYYKIRNVCVRWCDYRIVSFAGGGNL